MDVDRNEALRLAKKQAEQEADKMFKPGERLLDRNAAIARLTHKYFLQYTQP